MKRTTLFILALVLWIVLVWPFDGTAVTWDGFIKWQEIVTGIFVALLVTLVMKDVKASRASRAANPVRYFWGVVYLVVLGYYIVKANLDVAYRVLHPDMPINPGIVRVKTTLKTAPAITALANSITLTPGTLTVNATEDGILYVHWINVESTEDEEAAELITRRFEWYIKRILE